MNISILGIDIAKEVFHFHGVDGRGKEVYRKRLYRSDVMSELRGMQETRVVLESRGGSNLTFWSGVP